MTEQRQRPCLQGVDKRTIRLAVFSVTFALAMAFAAYTNHAWEDYYITFRVSKNLATGQGLVYTPGERLHVFTSPLGVLVPALLSFATGNKSGELVLWLFRILSSTALAAAALVLLKIARARSFHWLPATVLVGMLALDAKTVDFSINGMETGLMVLFLALALDALLVPARFPVLRMGLAWAALMWTRPDSFIYIGALCLGFLVFNPGAPTGQTRRILFGLFVRAGLLAFLVYSPWLLWAWHYYGSPIPHTVTAKGLRVEMSPWHLIKAVLVYPIGAPFLSRSFEAMFQPPYAFMSPWGWPIIWSRALACLTAFVWIIPRVAPVTRALSLAILVGLIYLDVLCYFPFPWYFPSVTLMAFVVLASLVQQLLGRGQCHSPSRPIGASGSFIPRSAWVCFFILLGTSLCFIMATAVQSRVQQAVIEEANRRKIGEWLSQHAASRADTVFLEPLGYIGYFSQLKMLDFPGLSSREVVAARIKTKSDEAAVLISELRPDWLVLRPTEVGTIARADPQLLTDSYHPMRTFDVSDILNSYQWLPSRDYLKPDQAFTVFKRSH